MRMLGRLLPAAMVLLLLGADSEAELSHSPRQTGEEVLDEFLLGPDAFFARVGSNGCTNKDSFALDVQKRKGLTERMPHYLVTLRRIQPDECKALIEDGPLLLFHLESDLGLKGPFTYSLTNPVFAIKDDRPTESLLSIIEKHLSFALPVPGEIRPEPFEPFVMDHDYFSCLVPVRWALERDAQGDARAGIYEIRLTPKDRPESEEGKEQFLPSPFVYVGYYTEHNAQKTTYEGFLTEYEKLRKKREGSEKSRYEPANRISLNGREAVEQVYEVYQEVPRGPLFTARYWLKARFLVIDAGKGFYVLAYKSPLEEYERHLPLFEAMAASFRPLF